MIMFSTQEYLDKKTGPYGIPRDSYLRLIVDEYKTSSTLSAKQQVMANLANFAYDPINLQYLKELQVLDIFLDALCEQEDASLIEYAVHGICNLCAYPPNRDYFITNGGIQLLQKQLSSEERETVVTSITALISLLPAGSESIPYGLVATMLRFSNSHIARIANVAKVFLADCCSKSQKDAASVELQQWNEQGMAPQTL